MSYKRNLDNYGIYHVYFRGIDGLAVFGLPEDKDVFLKQLSSSQKRNGFLLYAYSLMNTHCHLLYKDVGINLPFTVGNLLENYAIYYNAGNKRSGPVFENPFKSKLVLTQYYFNTLVSYIENNPVDAGIVKVYSDYPWNSSISGYSKYNLIDTMYLNHQFSQYRPGKLDHFIRKNNNKGRLCEFEVSHLTYEEANVCFYNIVKNMFTEQIRSFNNLEKHQKEILVKQAYYSGLSIRQIANISGISIRFIRENKGERNYL